MGSSYRTLVQNRDRIWIFDIYIYFKSLRRVARTGVSGTVIRPIENIFWISKLIRRARMKSYEILSIDLSICCRSTDTHPPTSPQPYIVSITCRFVTLLRQNGVFYGRVSREKCGTDGRTDVRAPQTPARTFSTIQEYYPNRTANAGWKTGLFDGIPEFEFRNRTLTNREMASPIPKIRLLNAQALKKCRFQAY